MQPRENPLLHLVGSRHEAQELIDVAHEQPIRVELYGGLYQLGPQEVPEGLVHVLAAGAGTQDGPEMLWEVWGRGWEAGNCP